MSTARLISPPIRSKDRPDIGSRWFQLLAPLGVDLGIFEPALHLWESEAKYRVVKLSPRHEDERTTDLWAPRGFTTDGASIPTVAQAIAGDRDCYRVAAVFHDLLYRLGAHRALADDVFHRIARSGPVRVGPVRAWLSWAAVRLFARRAYRRSSRKPLGWVG